MRNLNAKQKRLLDKWINEYKQEIKAQGGYGFFRIDQCNFFQYSLLEELERINDHETIIQNINSYISDKATKIINGVEA